MGISSHELHKEFPQYSNLIDELKENDQKFNEKFKRYAELDQEIVGLEKRDLPISDDKIHRMKQQRAELKDELYQTLVQNGEG